MIRVNAQHLYNIASAVRAMAISLDRWEPFSMYAAMQPAQLLLQSLQNQNLVPTRGCRITIAQLDEQITTSMTALQAGVTEENWGKHYASTLRSLISNFEVLFGADLNQADWYAVTPKGGFDTLTLAEFGTYIFPSELFEKVPAATTDAQYAARCMAFELPISAAFHLHRIVETVLRAYFDTVRGTQDHPQNRALGPYIERIQSIAGHDKKVVGALNSLKNLHRNPLIHPEISSMTVDESIALHGSVRSVVTYMISSIPPPAPMIEAA